LFARAIFASRIPFSIVENEYWKEFFHKLKPSFRLPSRYELGNSLLNKEYDNVSVPYGRFMVISFIMLRMGGSWLLNL
jgi:hypothetical protein